MHRLSRVLNHFMHAGSSVSSASSVRVVGIHGVGLDSSSLSGICDCLELFDLPGHGKGQKLASYSPGDGLKAVEDFVGKSEGVILVGHSLGAYLSLRFAVLHPEKVKGLVCIAGGPGFKKPGAMQTWNENYNAHPRDALAHHFDSLVIDRLSELDKIPLLIIVGSEDRPFVNAANYMKLKLPQAQVNIIEGAGHTVILSHKKQVGDLIEAFLKKK